MDVLNPTLLWGLCGVAVPVLIHLLNRFRYRTVKWGAMELLRKALVVRSRRVKLEDLILLAVRCSAVLLVALALSRPTVTPRGGQWLSAGAGGGAVIAIDGSFSMGHRPGIGSRMERALDKARAAAATLAPGAPMSVLVLGDRPRVLLRNVGLDPERLGKALEGLAPLPEGLALESGLEEIEGLADELRAHGRECCIVTDAQASSWRDPSPRAREVLHAIARKARVFLLPVGGDNDQNLAIESLEHAAGAPRAGAVARFRVVVRNAGSRARENVTVTLHLDDAPVDTRTLERIAPGESVEAALYSRFEREGSAAVTARIEGDALPADDRRDLVVEVRARLRALCVDGDPAPGGAAPGAGETGYLVAALEAGDGGLEAGTAVETIGSAELAGRDLSGYDIIFLADVPDTTAQAAQALLNFARARGGLVFFLGDATEPAVINARFGAQGVDLLPAEILAAAAEEPGGAGRGRAIASGTSGHPLALALRTLKPELLDEARVGRFFSLRLAADALPVLTLAGSDDVLLAERDAGRGKVLLFASSADGSWNDLPANPAFPILVQETARYLTSAGNERPIAVGRPIVVALPPEIEGEEVVFRDPAGASFPVTVERSAGARLVRAPRADLPGIYTVEAAAGGRGLRVAVNVDCRESDVRALDASALAAAVEGAGVRVVGEGEDLAAALREGRTGRELWRELILAAIALFLLESFLGKRFAHRAAQGGVR